MASDSALRIENLTKEFGGVPAVSDASLSIAAGESVALLGENGAGKSTLMKVVAGIYPSGTYKGRMFLGGEELQCRNVRDAESKGIVLVPQELHIAPNLTIAENAAMGVLPHRFGIVDRAGLYRHAKACLDFFGMQADPGKPASALSASEQRLLMISAALSRAEPRVLILDEPTASLTEGEARHMYERIRRVSKSGVATILITHRLDEIQGVCDRAIVLRNGEVVLQTDNVTNRDNELVRAMIGREPETAKNRAVSAGGKIALSVSGLKVQGAGESTKPYVNGANLDVRFGEIVGLFGLVGAGRTELAKAVFGAWGGDVAGEVSINGVAGRPRNPKEALARGLAMLTEDRKRSGIIEGQSVLFNMSAASIERVSSWGLIKRRQEYDRDYGLARRLDLRPLKLSKHIETYSGGNQQKVMLAKWLATEPDVLIADEPTYGVDVGARYEIYQVLRQLADAGKAILLISSDLEEIINETDRVLVMYKGRVTGEFERGTARHVLMAAATGQSGGESVPEAERAAELQ
ncbi:MAG: sugar ABC transporter ATP-binding protein [Hyphomicrobiaceae bacterium]|nr:sugar ABC transporter ATP-binding protein [Hyphomicrobiaceae bacterium]